jgi:hypothetical protein
MSQKIQSICFKMNMLGGSLSLVLMCLLVIFVAPIQAQDAAMVDAAGQLQSLESVQSTESRKLDKAADEVAWLLGELKSNGLLDKAGGEKVTVFRTTIADLAEDNLPAAAQHLRNARLEADASQQHLTSADREIDTIIDQLSKVLAGSSTLLVQEELVNALKEIIKSQTEVRGRTAEWGKALLISPDTAGAGKGPLMQDQTSLINRVKALIEKLEAARDETQDESVKSRFKQAALALKPAETGAEILKEVLTTDPPVTKVLQAAVTQIDSAEVLYAVDAQDRGLVMLKASLQILSAGQSDLADFVAGLEKLLKKQRELRKEVAAEETLDAKAAFFEARQVEIMDEVTNYTFEAPDLFVSKEGEFLVEPMLTALAGAVAAINGKEKDKTLVEQDKVIVLLESVYGTAEEAEEEEDGKDPFWAASPAVGEEYWKLPPDGDEEDDMLEDEDMPEIFEGITDVALMIQEDSVTQGAQADVSTAMAANRFISLEADDEGEKPDYITDEGPPAAGSDKDAPDAAGEDTVGNTDEMKDKGRLADEAIQRRRQRAKVQEYVRDLPPEFRRQVSDYYELIAE